MNERRSFLVALGAAALCASAARGAAAAPVPAPGHVPVNAVAEGMTLDSYFFPDSVVTAGQKLLLNGVSPAYSMGLKVIVVGLYSVRRHTTMEGLLADKGPKRVNFFFFRDSMAKDATSALLDRMKQNVSREEFYANIMQTSQLGGNFIVRRRYSKGDEVTIDYQPEAQSTDFFLNHVKFGESIQGAAFFGMLLKVFVGPNVRERDALLQVGTEP